MDNYLSMLGLKLILLVKGATGILIIIIALNLNYGLMPIISTNDHL